jgi:hypothetical protein
MTSFVEWVNCAKRIARNGKLTVQPCYPTQKDTTTIRITLITGNITFDGITYKAIYFIFYRVIYKYILV